MGKFIGVAGGGAGGAAAPPTKMLGGQSPPKITPTKTIFCVSFMFILLHFCSKTQKFSAPAARSFSMFHFVQKHYSCCENSTFSTCINYLSFSANLKKSFYRVLHIITCNINFTNMPLRKGGHSILRLNFWQIVSYFGCFEENIFS